MNLPPFVKSLAFWTAASWVVAGVLALLVYFGVVPATWGIPATVILTWVLALLNMFGITPELRAKALIQEMREFKEEFAAYMMSPK
jgi:hypothetical protein